MADQTSPTAAKKSNKKGGCISKAAKRVLDLFNTRPKSVDDSASQLNSTRVSVSSASGAHDPILATDEGSIEPIASSKHIGSVVIIDDNLTSLQAAMLP
jgi:hypothetical protein